MCYVSLGITSALEVIACFNLQQIIMCLSQFPLLTSCLFIHPLR